jgi:NOL1/NOP2/fmu family ribosome biogenesis protein
VSDGPGNDGDRFDRLPATPAEREVPGRAARSEVVAWWDERFGVGPETFDGHTFWEKGAGKVWVVHGDRPTPIAVEGLGMTCLRTRQEFWKPTTDAVQRFGDRATRNVVVLSDDEAARFMAGEDQDVAWDGDWGYLIAARETAGETVPLGVGLFTYGELQSKVPKGRRR